jgi:hypothetical protein
MEDKRDSFSLVPEPPPADAPAPVTAPPRRRIAVQKPAAKKAKAAAPAKKAKASTRKPAAGKARVVASKTAPAPARKGAPPRREGLEKMLASFSQNVSRAGASVSSVSSDGVRAAKRAWNRAGVASKGTVKRVLKEWKGLDPKRRASYVAALVGALAAASAPIVRAQMKKR